VGEDKGEGIKKMKKVKVIVLRTAGTNCDKETVFAFQAAGADVDLIHINELIQGRKNIEPYKILALPGGFSYGDDIAAGKVLANELIYKLRRDLRKFVRSGRLVIGICNGFQVLVKTGLLPHSTLTFNDSGKFEDRWVYLKNMNRGNCVFTRGIERIYLPVAHGEGKFVTDSKTLKGLEKNDEIVFKYVDGKGKEAGYPWNPNGSMESIAGICNKEGNVFGMMPHPERFLTRYQHPHWTRFTREPFAFKTKTNRSGSRHARIEEEGDGLKIFRNAVDYALMHL